MGVKVGLLFLLVLGISWLNNVNARNIVRYDLHATQENYKGLKDDRVCTMCKQYSSLAINYLAENKTQTEIIDALHHACSRMHSFKQQCTTLVDYYAPLFFQEVAGVEPVEFCSKMDLCNIMESSSQDSCTVCHEAVAEVLNKLEDPDTQLEIIEILLKVCNKTDQYAKKCKRLVFEYGPLIMANAEKFLTKNDLCTVIHACKTSPDGGEVATSSLETSLVAESVSYKVWTLEYLVEQRQCVSEVSLRRPQWADLGLGGVVSSSQLCQSRLASSNVSC
ncbi:saposin B domain-containing protein [Thalictrum thalictroides]|uniref:Pulmonary surfactant-associated protein B n=1 Tax=Thalictrum thalictroides TaxID=46969 RepID=A0A7J6VPP7_THATH|nr:saposin B domain-containing protein [Thalictrum thalictroides]